jgi:DNA-binding ferritin-like protein
LSASADKDKKGSRKKEELSASLIGAAENEKRRMAEGIRQSGLTPDRPLKEYLQNITVPKTLINYDKVLKDVRSTLTAVEHLKALRTQKCKRCASVHNFSALRSAPLPHPSRPLSY